MGIVENRKEPGAEVRSWLEAIGETESLDERVLHEIFCIAPIPGQAERRAVEPVEVPQRLGFEACPALAGRIRLHPLSSKHGLTPPLY